MTTINQNSNTKSFKIWWELTRPHTLTAGFVPVFIGTMYALKSGHFKGLLFLAMLFASLCIQAATNMFNEYYDFKRGLDNADSVGIGGAIVREGVAPATIMKIALSLYFISLLIGVYICNATSWWLAAIGLVSMLFGYLYTGGPIPIAYTPFGELVAGFFMGFEIISISYYIQTGTFTPSLWLVSLPASLLIANILMANNIRDFDNDKISGRKTLAIVVGKSNARSIHKAFFYLAYLTTFIMPFVGLTNIGIWIVFLGAPITSKAIEGFKQLNLSPKEMANAMIATAKTNTIFGFLFGIGLYASIWM